MDRAGYVHKRKRKYMAQILEHFEQHIAPHLPPEAAGDVHDFKGLVRARVNALAVDSVDVMGYEQNGVALEVRDRMSPIGRP